MKNILYKKIIAFIFFGSFAIVFEFFAYSLFLHIGFHYLISTIVSYWLGASVSFLLNNYYNFNKDGNVRAQIAYIKYLSVNLIAFSIDFSVVFLLVNFIFANFDAKKIIAKVFSIIIVAVVTFILHNFWTFKIKKNV
jgi:putative flippase GtrA